MKIGLFSPFYSHNYGTVLQAFALQYYLKKQGNESEYIRMSLFSNFKQKLLFIFLNPLYLYFFFQKKWQNRNSLKYDFLTLPEYAEILKKNENFSNHYITKSTKRYTYFSTNKLEKEYDLFIVGSDQTWSPEIIYKYSAFFLPFVKHIESKGSYACSFGTNKIGKDYKRFLKKNLAKFHYLSCRDKSNAEMLSSLLNRKVYHVVDPTLLLTYSDWKSYMKPVDVPSKYILCYILGEKECIANYANLLGNSMEIPVYYILTRPAHAKQKNVLENIGCQEFLYLIANCELLVTDSFHGTIFSINFNRNVIAFDKYSGDLYDNGRLRDVLESLGIGDHYHLDSDYTLPNSINYEAVNKKLEDMRNSSYDYLKQLMPKK